jgi:hypothetical protein
MRERWSAPLAATIRERRAQCPYHSRFYLDVGTGAILSAAAVSLQATVQARLIGRKPAVSSKFQRLRGKDSNLDYLIQSQASYH